MQKKNYVQEILDIIHSGLPQAELAEKLSDYHENDLADALADLTAEERRKLYAILGVEQVAEIFSYLDDAESYLKELPPEEAAQVVSHMDSDDAVDALDDLEEEDKEKIVHQMDKVDKDAADDVKLLLSYDEDEIGSCMTTNYIYIRKDMTIRQAMSELVKQAGENDNISTLYVVDENERFYGAIDLKDLIVARADDSLEKLIARSYPYVTDHEKISDCIDRIVDYAERSLPVLDENGKLLGIITSADVVELVDDQMGDDYAKLGGLTSEEDLNEGVFQSVKKRLPWLVALLFLGMLVSSVVGAFESVVAVLPIVICFQSMVLDMAGNVGTQSLAVTIRVLVDENLTTSKKLHLLFKEMRVGLVNGALLAVMALGFLGVYIHFFKAYAWGEAFLLSGCVGISLIVAMVISSLVGTVIPMLFHKIHIDPAVASGPLITTINDLVAVVVYYGLAMIVLIDMFHLG
ncbi:magnesium transporter [Faecalibacterium sp. OF04-11AC]|uniref:magnesium transporter n=1 Tax=Faecalibacterium sp. OF04-11AC TaxID=2293109 RepID=UPI000E9B8920|nr:magnesium transporter [Faecalibacterium sp. OF04-11AC]RGF78449.1 magnesium transporter [Faecalibacterium sp. OF04-11AC]